MNEEADYAEMLEIPVSTVNVVKRKNKRKKEDLREQVFDKVNERVEEEPFAEEDARTAESTVISRAAEGRASGFFVASDKKTSAILIGEFAAACLICTAIFLTNIFMPNSAINAFLGGLFAVEEEAADTRTYADFELNAIVNEYSSVSVQVSANGVMSLTGACYVYPVCDGTVESVTLSGGTYTVSIAHSDSFESIVTGLTTVCYEAGDSVKGNIPLGYTDGSGEVNVMLYDNDSLLSCVSVDEENALSWKS